MSKSPERLYSFFETPIFMRQIEQPASMKVLFAIEDDLLKNPERGDVIQGTRGARKARIGDPDSRRGEARQLPVHIRVLSRLSSHSSVVPVCQNDTADLSAQVKKQLAKLVSQIKESIK